MLVFRNLTLSYRRHVIVDRATGSFAPGTISSLVAPNGRGKTTLLRALANLHGARARGLIAADGVPITRQHAYRELVFYAAGDGGLLYPSETVRAHLKMVGALWRSALNEEEVIAACRLEGFLSKRVSACSQGMKQQLVLALALMTGARYLLLDEPMNALDPTSVDRFSALFGEAVRSGRAIILSSHILGNVSRISSRVLFLDKGKLEEQPVGDANSLLRVYYARYGNGREA